MHEIMLLKRVPLSQVFAQADLSVVEALGGAAAQLDVPGAWHVVTPVSDCASRLEGSRLFKSIKENVNDDEKRACFVTMSHALYRATKHADYANELANSGMKCKVAHTFAYGGGTQKVWELKQGKKDRIYFFTIRREVGGKMQSFIVLLLAEHKNSQTTPDHVKKHAETVIKACLNPREKLETCKEPS